MTTQALKTGHKIYYSGDMANQPGWFKVSAVSAPNHSPVFYDLAEIDGERLKHGIRTYEIGDKYMGHCNPRFVTVEAYQAFMAERSESLKRALAT